MTEKEFLDKEIPLLMKKGYSKQQAAAIAYSLFSKEEGKAKAQQGILKRPSQDYAFETPNPNDIKGWSPYVPNQIQQDQAITGYTPNTESVDNSWLPQYEEDKNNGVWGNNYQDFYNTNIFNPYGGVSLESSLFTLGQGLGEKDPYKTGLGAGTSLLKVGRIGMAGFATGKEDDRVKKEMFKKLYEDRRRPQYMLEGGDITNADLLTGQYVTDNPNPTIEAEHGEYLKNNETGEVQKIIGEDHENGGVGISINDGKILSDYTKIGAKNAKELKEKYQLSLRATDTFAKAMDKINDKIGVTKTAEELSAYIERLRENEAVKDDATKRLNETALAKTIEKHQEKLDTLKGAQNFAFEDIFSLQEAKGKIGDGKTLLDKKGKPMEKKENIAQEGGIQFSAALTPEEERAAQAPQMPIKRILYNVGTNEVKEGSLQPGNYHKVEYEGGRQDYLTPSGYDNLKRMSNYRVYQENLANKNRPITQTQPLATLQEGGHIHELAKKHGISVERAMELTKMQEGGEVNQEDQMQQVMGMIAQQLQSGVSPEEVAQKLTENGIPAEQVQQLIQAVAQQLQGQSSQEQVAQEGGSTRVKSKYENPDLYKKQDATSEDWTSFGELLKTNPEEVTAEIQRLHPELYAKFFVKGKLPKEKVQDFQEALDKKYDAIQTDAKKLYGEDSPQYKQIQKGVEQDRFVLASMENPSVRGRDNKFGNYTATRPNFALNILPKADLEKVQKAGINTASQLKEKFPELHKKYIEPKGLTSDFWLGEVNNTVQPTAEAPIVDTTQTPEVRNLTKWMMPNLPVDFVLPPSAMQMVAKEYIPLDRIQPIKQTVEPYLAESERQRATAAEQLSATGLPPQIQEAISGQQLAASQLAANDAIGKVENFNAQNQFQADQFNIGQAGKEDLLNAQFNQDYMNKMFQTVANQERDLRGYYNQLNLNNRRDFRDISALNLTNALSENFDSDGSTITFQDNKPYNLGYTPLPKEQWEKMSAQEQFDFVQNQTKLMNAAKMKNNYLQK